MRSHSPRSPVAARSAPLSSPRLRRLAQGAGAEAGSADQRRPGQPGAGTEEVCELCGTPIEDRHRHLVDLDSRELLCTCRACSLLFDRAAAGGGHYRLVPERRLRLEQFVLSDAVWDQLRIPVDMAFFFHSSQTHRAAAFYPSPMGATESRLELPAWEELQRANPILAELEPDVEALLVNRGVRRQWLVPIDDCYRLVATIRTRWRGFSGGKEVWQAIDAFFDDLDRRAAPDRQPTTAKAVERS